MRTRALLLGFALSASCEPSEADYVRFATQELPTGAGCCENADRKECPDTAPKRCPFLRDPVVKSAHASRCCNGDGMQVWLELNGGRCMYQVVRGPQGGLRLDGAQCMADTTPGGR
jgi:hypothetical protein